MGTMKKFTCYDCGSSFEIPCGSRRPMTCPSCKCINIYRSPKKRGYAGGGRRRRSGFGSQESGREPA